MYELCMLQMSLTNQSAKKIEGMVSVELLLYTGSPLDASWDPVGLTILVLIL
jgi:hypothetical protein